MNNSEARVILVRVLNLARIDGISSKMLLKICFTELGLGLGCTIVARFRLRYPARVAAVKFG